MKKNRFTLDDIDIAWCPGCGNFGILNTIKESLNELDIEPSKLVLVSGIGQAAKLPHYLKTNLFNGLHGRYLSSATAIKSVNPALTVIAVSGDGCTYAEGGNHFIHTIRRNPDITNIVHNNMVYGLTKGQASPTSQMGFKTPVQVDGVFVTPFNPIAIAIALDASFVARTFIGDVDKTKEIIKQAILHKGYALVDVLQPCVTFNKFNTYSWFREHTYYLDNSYNPLDRYGAFKKACEEDPMPLGIIYKNPKRTTFEENLNVYKDDKIPIIYRNTEKRLDFVKKFFEENKGG